ncbi:MAG: metal-dependent hydrolase [Sandaracinaceae bacterium]
MSVANAASPPRIEVRRLDYRFDPDMSVDFAGNPLLSALFGALSVAFGPGERLFIESVRHYLPEVDDKALRRDVYAFIGQEANHTDAHHAFNARLEDLGYPAAHLEESVRRRIERVSAAAKPEVRLAWTVALEHFTAIIASGLLTHPDVLERMHPDVARLWAWHAVEEIEHRSVAFDVYQRVVGDEALRRRTMRLVTVMFLSQVSYRTVVMMRQAGTHRDVRGITRGLGQLFGRRGLLSRILPRYLDFYRAGFHPEAHDESGLIAQALERYVGDFVS